MKNTLAPLYALLLGAAFTAPAMAQDHANHSTTPAAAAVSMPSADAAAVMTTGEITRVDARNGKLTIRHAEIKNLDMPAMTMVFGVKDAAQASKFKPGDKVLFHVEDDNGALTITRIQSAS